MDKKEYYKTVFMGVIELVVISTLLLLLRRSGIVFTDANEIILRIIGYIGLFLVVVGLIYFIIERLSGLPFFYGRSQRGGSNVNSFAILAIGIAFLNMDIKTALIVLVSMVILVCLLSVLLLIIKPGILDSNRN